MDNFRFLILKSLKATNNQTVTKTVSIQLNTVCLRCDMNYHFLSTAVIYEPALLTFLLRLYHKCNFTRVLCIVLGKKFPW